MNSSFSKKEIQMAHKCMEMFNILSDKDMQISRAPMAHACDPSYSEVRDQEDHDSKPTWANCL
jgi:hypothetical protein